MKQVLKKILNRIGLLGSIYRMSYRTGLISMIPSIYIRALSIHETNDPLVPISSEKLLVFCPEEETVVVRKEVLKKLLDVTSKLPNGYKLKVLYAYRSLDVQRKFWEEVCLRVKQENPSFSADEVVSEARKYSASPTGEGPHQTGGAVDVLIVNEKGDPLDFGTEYRGFGELVPMHSRLVTKKQKENRILLRDAMLSAGFVYYPGEWWHYSFGDQAWAAYTGNKYAWYGSV